MAETDRVGTINVETGELSPDFKRALDKVYLPANEIVVNVYNFDAVDVSGYDVSTQALLDAAPSSQAALDKAVAEAERIALSNTLTPPETRVWVQIPHGAVRGSIRVKSPYVCFLGPGALVDGEILYQSATTNALPRFHSIVREVTFRPLNAALSRPACGIRTLGAAFVDIVLCRFRDMSIGVTYDTWENLEGQQNKNIDTFDCTFINVDYAVKNNRRAGTTWDSLADSRFMRNKVRNAYISHGWIDGADGYWSIGNQCFCVGRDSTDTFHKVMKSHSWYYGPRTSFAFYESNENFEAGLSGLYLDRVTDVKVRGGDFAWSGQNKQTPAILINLSSDYLSTILIDGVTTREGTGNPIGIIGDGDASKIKIPDTNNLGMISDTQRNVYRGDSMGNGPLDLTRLAQVSVASTVKGLPQIVATQSPKGTRRSVIDMKGMYSSARRSPWSDHTETITNHRKSFSSAVTSAPICFLASITEPVSTSNYTGLVEVIVKGTNTSGTVYVARYEFTASANGANKTVANLRESGSAVAASGLATPAFTFTINVSDGNLVATRKGTDVVGTFEFTVKASGLVQTSYIEADFLQLPLLEQPSGT